MGRTTHKQHDRGKIWPLAAVAQWLKIPATDVALLVAAGDIEVTKVGRRTFGIAESEFRRFIRTLREAR